MRSRQWVFRLVTMAAIGLSAAWAGLPGSAAEAGVPGDVGASTVRAAAVQPASLVRDSGPQLRSKQGLPAPVMSSAMLSANAEKQAAARTFVGTMRSQASPEVTAKCTSKSCRSGLPAARDPAGDPAGAGHQLLLRPGHGVGDAGPDGQEGGPAGGGQAAEDDHGGTDWSNPGGYPVPKVLNKNQSKNNYVAVGLPWSPTKAQIKTFETDLVTDINHNGGVPLAGNAYEVPGGPHLVGHPVNQTIFHWFDIRGYKNSGATTDYEDSVHGASSIGWAATVPAYSSLPSKTIVTIIGARGYAW